jgi:hypothetical protein
MAAHHADYPGIYNGARKYEKHISWWISHRGNGLYDALNNGFSHSTGDIMGWLNASDLLHTNGLFVVGSVFRILARGGMAHGQANAL